MVHFIIITSAAKCLKNGSGRLPALQNGSHSEELLGRKGCRIMSFLHELNLASVSVTGPFSFCSWCSCFASLDACEIPVLPGQCPGIAGSQLRKEMGRNSQQG